MTDNQLLLNLFAAPVLILIGVIVKGIWDFVGQRMATRVSNKQVTVSETEAQTHQFQAIIDGFTQSLAAVNQRATTAEDQSARANNRADSLENRVDQLEDERVLIIDHLNAVEALVPHPPGPPPRPPWLR